jgi:predicted phosphodiesterase
MRFAAISDIHGNLPALDAVLADIAAQGIGSIVNLGDIVSGPLWPTETAARLIPLNLPTLAGNHERQVLTHPREKLGATDRHTQDELRPGHRDWLASLPGTLAWQPGVFLFHGTPTDDLVYLLETVTGDFAPAQGRPGLRAATLAEIEARVGDCRPDGAHPLLLCGHTHVPRDVRLADRRRIVNPGSVGLQAYPDDHPHPHVVENGSPHARYAVLALHATGWEVDLRQVPYDFEYAAARAEHHHRPDWAHALRTGRWA